ncbi:hypothetical protein [uncultured Gimesia sp.]|uniref:SecDF P1 head subdomain-containing protein n=1 Tax=uncultured Gimesia sp. TaxID=1678688 RepID=UPI0030DBD442|tara:strand:+ start:159766 stop:160230 length:465 start_codon:yes stop_codon:yes gene_type:complete
MRILQCACLALLLLTGCAKIKNVPRPLAKKATLELYIVSPIKTPTTKQATIPDTNATIYLTTPAIITAADVATVQRSEDTPDIPPALIVNLTPAGETKLALATANPAGMQIAMLINGTVVSVPKVITPLSSTFHITISATSEKYEQLFDSLTKN